MKGADLSDRAV